MSPFQAKIHFTLHTNIYNRYINNMVGQDHCWTVSKIRFRESFRKSLEEINPWTVMCAKIVKLRRVNIAWKESGKSILSSWTPRRIDNFKTRVWNSAINLTSFRCLFPDCDYRKSNQHFLGKLIDRTKLWHLSFFAIRRKTLSTKTRVINRATVRISQKKKKKDRQNR